MNTPRENIIKTLSGKKVLFLEGDWGLYDGLDEFEKILKSVDIEYKALFNIEQMPLDDILEEIKQFDAIVFMSQWVYDRSLELKRYMLSSQDKKTVVEVYIDKPTYSAVPNGVVHDIYIYTVAMYFGEAEEGTEEFYKLSDNHYCNYENKFDR